VCATFTPPIGTQKKNYGNIIARQCKTLRNPASNNQLQKLSIAVAKYFLNFNCLGKIQSRSRGGSWYFLDLSYSSCLHPNAQFRFLDNGAMFNLARNGCVAASNKGGSGYDLDMFYLYVGDSSTSDTTACATKRNAGLHSVINQTAKGALSIQYRGKDKSSFETWCAILSHHAQLSDDGIKRYVGLTTECYDINSNKKFLFGIYL
jgi:hypothetical protein